MSKCELRINLDNPCRTYKGGDKITGSVGVTVHRDCECRGLVLSLGWRTKGKSRAESAEVRTRGLYAGSWQAGESASYAFELDALYGPLSYQGKLVSVEWFLRACADIPGAVDPKAEEIITLLPAKPVLNGEPGDDGAAKVVWEGSEAAGAGFGRSQFGWKAGIGLLVAITMILRDVYQYIQGRDRDLPYVILIILCMVLVGLTPGLLRSIAKRKLGPVDVALDRRSVRRGGTLACAVRFCPRSKVNLTEATARLLAKEKAVSDPEDDENTHTATVWRIESTLATDRHLIAGEGITLAGELVVPADAPPTFSCYSSSLEWIVEIHLNLRRWPDWTRSIPIVVRP